MVVVLLVLCVVFVLSGLIEFFAAIVADAIWSFGIGYGNDGGRIFTS